ncbi:hypothetical protein NM688_g7436 [Phlebia brevispora]|uniref:Uncharacterized protein n=1 Tax=Phlebia brevispora TaxID=194682 RepID=A0ACC1S598_9APHY|nr:hypothetical protein NM688_g7436 [Phlebia brevispora]
MRVLVKLPDARDATIRPDLGHVYLYPANDSELVLSRAKHTNRIFARNLFIYMHAGFLDAYRCAPAALFLFETAKRSESTPLQTLLSRNLMSWLNKDNTWAIASLPPYRHPAHDGPFAKVQHLEDRRSKRLPYYVPRSPPPRPHSCWATHAITGALSIGASPSYVLPSITCHRLSLSDDPDASLVEQVILDANEITVSRSSESAVVAGHLVVKKNTEYGVDGRTGEACPYEVSLEVEVLPFRKADRIALFKTAVFD